jgi:hypothetical protein
LKTGLITSYFGASIFLTGAATTAGLTAAATTGLTGAEANLGATAITGLIGVVFSGIFGILATSPAFGEAV